MEAIFPPSSGFNRRAYLLYLLLAVFFASTAFGKEAAVIYVVDRPSSPDEFSDLASAIETLCLKRASRIVMNRSAPLFVSGRIDVGCDVTIEAELPSRGQLVFSSGAMLVSRGELSLVGLVLFGSVSVSAGSLEVRRSAFASADAAALTARGALRFSDNELGQSVAIRIGGEASPKSAMLVVERNVELARTASSVARESFLGAGRLSVRSTDGTGFFADFRDNSLSALEVGLCGARARIVGDRLGRLVLAETDCGPRTGASQVDVVRAMIDRLEIREPSSVEPRNLSLRTAEKTQVGALRVDWRPEARIAEGSRLELLSKATRFNGEFFWDSIGAVALSFEDVDVEPNANLTNLGSIEADFSGVVWRGGLTINALSAGNGARPLLSIRQRGGFSNGNVDLTTAAEGAIRGEIDGLELGPASRIYVGRRDRAAAESAQDAHSAFAVRGVSFTKPGQYLQVAGLDGRVVIERSKFNLGVSELAYAGLRLSDHGDGQIEVSRNEFFVPDSCDQACVGMRAQNVGELIVSSNKFFVYGKNAGAIDLRDGSPVGGASERAARPRSVVLRDNEIIGGSQHGDLIRAEAKASAGSLLRAEHNKIMSSGLVAFLLKGPIFARFSENVFSGTGILYDGGGVNFAIAGGIVSDPLLDNAGLHDKNVVSAIDFDGNGCRDIPRSSNQRDQEGYCGAPGKPKPVWP